MILFYISTIYKYIYSVKNNLKLNTISPEKRLLKIYCFENYNW